MAKKINITAQLNAATTDGILADAGQIFDAKKGKFQEQVNQEFEDALEEAITSEETDKVVESIEEGIIHNALRKTKQILTEAEKYQARHNISAITAEEAEKIAQDKINEAAVSSPDKLQAVKELSSWLESNPDSAATMNEKISENAADIQRLYRGTGIDEYSQFSTGMDYAAGDVVLYDGVLFRFKADHAAGEWDYNEVEEWSEKKEVLYDISPRPIRLLEKGTIINEINNIAITGETGLQVRLAVYKLPNNNFTLKIAKTGNAYQRIYGYTNNVNIEVGQVLEKTSEEFGNREFLSIDINPTDVPYDYIVIGYDERGNLPVIIERSKGGIRNSSIVTEKIADEAVTIEKILNPIFLERGNKDGKKVTELWVDPKFKIEGGDYRVKITDSIFVRVYQSVDEYSIYWNCRVSLPDADTYNNTPIPLVVTNISSGYEEYLNKVVGYIVLTDAHSCEEDGRKGDKLSDWIFKIGNFPIINEYTMEIPNEAVTTDKLADEAVTTNKLSDEAVTAKKLAKEIEYYTTKDLYDYTGTVSELYIKPELVPEGATLRSKGYNEVFYIRPYIGSTMQWNASVVLPSIEDNQVVEIKCIIAGGNVNIGDTVGYVVFKNKQIIIDAAKIDAGAGEYLDTKEVTTLLPWGKIKEYVTGIDGSLIKEQSITTEKLADRSITPNKLANNVNIQSAIEAGLDMALPDEIIAVEGDYLQIFWRSIIHAFNPYVLDIVSSCSVGAHYPRYFYFLPKAEHVGKTYTLKVAIRSNNLNTLVSKTTTIKVVAKPTSPATKTNVLCIGASATATGYWAHEAMRRLTMTDGTLTPVNPIGLGLENISFVGRKRGSSANVQLEATGGWRVQDYAGKGRLACRFYITGVNQLNIGDTYSDGITTFTVSEINVTEGEGNIRCVGGESAASASGTLNRVSGNGDESITYSSYESESYNPFYNLETNAIDFVRYANTYCRGSIDVQIWHCGVNDIFGGNESAVTAAIEAYRTILRAYHSQFPNGKVIISSVPVGSVNGGFGANYGASESFNYYTFLNVAQKYASALFELCNDEEFSAYTRYAAVLEEFDAEYGYPVSQANVNNRQEIKENKGTNGVHPTPEGSYMVADSIYRAFADLNI